MNVDPPDLETERTVFLSDLRRQRPRRALGLMVCFVIAGGLDVSTLYGFGDDSALHEAARYVGGFFFVFALYFAFTTPWTERQREAMWRTQLIRLRRKAQASAGRCFHAESP